MHIIQETNEFPVRDGWVWRVCLVRLPNGKTEWYEIPDHRLGSLR